MIDSEVGRLRGSLSRLRTVAAHVRAGRILAQADHGRPHRPQWREDYIGARERALRSRRGEGARLRLASFSRNGRPPTRSGCLSFSPSVAAGSAAQPGRCLLISGLRRLRRDQGRGRPVCATPASILPRLRHRSATSPKHPEQFNAWAKRTGLPYRHLSLYLRQCVDRREL